jgi:hypothetical protein
MTADHGRAAVYAAEAAAFEGTDLESLLAFSAVAARIEAVVGGPWWPGPDVSVVSTRSDAGSSSARGGSGGGVVIRLAAEQLTVATAAHELAHALAGPGAGHSPVFLAAYLDVVSVITNLDSLDRRHQLHVAQLREAFADAGLLIGERTWPAPPEATGTAIVL